MVERIFLGTNSIIYLLNDIYPFKQKVRDFLVHHKQAEFYTSTITDAEFLVLPYREKDFTTVQSYRNFIEALHILRCFITDKVADQAAQIRANYSSIKLGDSLQLASSMQCQCTHFLTNDAQLRQVTDAHVIYLGDL